MYLEAKIDMNERRFTNHSGKVTCATTLYESGQFDEQAIMSRTGHRNTAVRKYKRASDRMLQNVSDALQPPLPSKDDVVEECTSVEENVAKKKCAREKEGKELPSNRKLQFTLKRGKTTLTLQFD